MKKKIVLDGLSANVAIGIHDFERKSPQPYKVNIALSVEPSYYAHQDKITETVDYDALRERVLALLSSRHFNLQETVIQSLMDICFSLDARVVGAQVQVVKTSVFPDCDFVGLDYSATRDEWNAQKEVTNDRS